jgi:hypothetical protein
MPGTVEWQGRPVVVRARLVPRFLWSTASLDVFVDGTCVLSTGGPLRLTGARARAFTHDGASHRVELSWGCGWLLSFPYRLEIDGALVAHARARVENWLLGLAFWAAAGCVVGSGAFWLLRR